MPLSMCPAVLAHVVCHPSGDLRERASGREHRSAVVISRVKQAWRDIRVQISNHSPVQDSAADLAVCNLECLGHRAEPQHADSLLALGGGRHRECGIGTNRDRVTALRRLKSEIAIRRSAENVT